MKYKYCIYKVDLGLSETLLFESGYDYDKYEDAISEAAKRCREIDKDLKDSNNPDYYKYRRTYKAFNNGSNR